jgi:hypothetical protein
MVRRHPGLCRSSYATHSASSRPYFLGILGERYGWHNMSETTGKSDTLLTESFNDAVANGHAWVNGFRDRSVTELEIIYGVLRYIPLSKMSSHDPEDYGYDVPDSEKEAELSRLNVRPSLAAHSCLKLPEHSRLCIAYFYRHCFTCAIHRLSIRSHPNRRSCMLRRTT